MLKKFVLYSCFCCCLAGFYSCSGKKAESGPARPAGNRGGGVVRAEGFIVKTTSLSENIEVPGTVLPFETTEIRPEISGRVTSLNIPEGRVVQRGTVLIQLFDGDLQAQLKKLEVQLSISEKTAERYKQLLEISGISQQEYDLSVLQVNNLTADIQLVKVDIEKTRIRAPYTGQVGLKNISLGAYVTPTNILTTISQVDNLKLEFTVPEKYSENMASGKEVSFTIGGVDKQFTARVMATESTIEANTRSLKVRAVVNGKQPFLVPGAFAKVSLMLDKNNEAIIIPTQAVIPKARNKQVIVLRAGNPKFEVITTGIRDSSFIQVTEGLKVGDTVLTSGLLAIREERKIELSKIQ